MTDWQGTVVAADIALLLFNLRQAAQEERRVTRACRRLSDERKRRCKRSARQRSAAGGLPLFPFLFFSLRAIVHICSEHLGFQSQRKIARKTISLLYGSCLYVVLGDASVVARPLGRSDAPRPALRINRSLTGR